MYGCNGARGSVEGISIGSNGRLLNPDLSQGSFFHTIYPQMTATIENDVVVSVADVKPRPERRDRFYRMKNTPERQEDRT